MLTVSQREGNYTGRTPRAIHEAVMGALGACGHVGALDLAVQQLAVPNLRADAETAVKSIAELIRKKHPQEVKAVLRKLHAK